MEHLVCILNFAGNPHEHYRVGLPFGGDWEEILNSDDLAFGGSGVTNPSVLRSEELHWNNRDNSVSLRVPPLGAVFLKPVKK